MIRFHSLVVSSYRLAMSLLYYFVRFCAIYIFQTRPKALKDNSLNFDEGLHGRVRILSYEQIPPLNIAEPATWDDIDSIINDNDVVIDGNGHN